jgi:hypothetical protein
MSSTSFSCPTPCCPAVSFIVFCQPGEVSGVPGDRRLVQLFETRRRECDGAEFGPFNITAIASWTSESSSVVEVGSVSESGCELSYESVGQTDIVAQYESVQYQFAPEEGGVCSPILVPIIHSCPVQVFQLKITVPDTPLPSFDVSENSAAIVAGETFGIIVEAVDSTGGVLPVNRAVSVIASRQLGSSETGLPSSINLINGRYVNGNLLLNRVNGTDSGTTYRFSIGGSFTDFFIYTYFRVHATHIGLVGNTTSCGHVVQINDHFVALPVAELCNMAVVVRNPVTGQSEATTKRDKGPHFPGPGTRCDPSGAMGGDFYWNTGTRPRVESVSCEAGNNNSGIDLADGTFAAVGSPTQVVWRFGSL